MLTLIYLEIQGEGHSQSFNPLRLSALVAFVWRFFLFAIFYTL